MAETIGERTRYRGDYDDATYWERVSRNQAWLGETLVLSTFYFKLLARFDEGMIFWVLLLLGLGLVYF